MTLGEFAKHLRISNRKAVWMLENGVVPYEKKYTKSTFSYVIKVEDMCKFQRMSKKARERCVPFGVCGSHPESGKKKLTAEDTEKFRKMLTRVLRNAPDDLSTAAASKLTGYSVRFFIRTIADGSLYAVSIGWSYHIPKSKQLILIRINLVSKSPWHREMIEKYLKTKK